MKGRKNADKRGGRLGQYLGVCLVCFGLVLTSKAQAGCAPGQEPFTSCQIEGRNTEVFVCFDDNVATYSYGPIGGSPELFLSETIAQVDFQPWSGLGTAISESVTFYNGDYGYDVGGGFDRPFSEEEMLLGPRRFGWVEVTQSGARIASLRCIPETVSYGFGGGLYDAKLAAGLIWDSYSATWISDRIPLTAAPILIESRQSEAVADCLPASEFRLNGVRMGDPLNKLGKLGSPEATEETTNGGQPIDRMTLVGAHIDLVQDIVVAMSTTSPDWHLPSGLRVGLTRGEVIRILGRVPNGYTATSQTFVAHVCSEHQDADDEWSLLIAFGQDKRVSSISFVSPSH